MSKLIDIVVVAGDWEGGHHGVYPKRFYINPNSKHPFCISEGNGWGEGGGCFDLDKLFEGNYLKIFNRPESEVFYQKMLKAYELNQDQESLVKELIKDFSLSITKFEKTHDRMTDFLVLPRRVGMEADIPLKSDVPPKVERIYGEKYSGKLVAWIDKGLSKCGCIYLNRSATTDFNNLNAVSIYEQRPAKGWGYVYIILKSTEGEELTTLFSSRHSAESLEWLKKTQKEVADFFKIKTEYEDHGYDA